MKVIDLFNKIYRNEIKPGTKFEFDGEIIRYNGVDFHCDEDGKYYCIDAEDLNEDIKEV